MHAPGPSGLLDNDAFYFFAPWRGAKYCDEYVRLSASISQKPHSWILPNFLCMLSMAVARSACDVMYFRSMS